MKPRVSVIMAVKNGEKFIREALESILEQSYSNFEILVIDGHSTDQTAVIARSFPKVIYQMQLEEGISLAYNQGVRAAQGEFIGFLSHDDRWNSQKLELQAHVLMTRSDVDYVICRARFFLENLAYIPPGFRKNLLVNDHVAPIMETLLARRSLFDRIGTFDPAYSFAEDVDWYLRAHDAGAQGEVLQQALVEKRIHDNNLSLISRDNHQNLINMLKKSIERKRVGMT